jgi:hypothetical protein
MLNASLLDKGYAIDESDPSTWKYYLNLNGKYHESDTVMKILSLDTQQEIEFRKSIINSHPRTRAAYRPGLPLYNDLISLYPGQSDLIKNILFPVNDIAEAITANDLTILAYGTGYLEIDELPKIIRDIELFLTYAGQRWYHTFLTYEPYYPPVFWGTLWQVLFACICDSRVQNMRTSYVHSYHVWDYLTSHGIGNYKDILTRKQSMFLYRNIRYITERRGRNDNLILLVNELLGELSVGMVGKTLYQQTFDNVETCIWTPEFVSEPIETRYSDSVPQQPPQTTFDITNRLKSLGYEIDGSFEYVQARTKDLQATSSNRLPTKLLEIQPVVINRQYSALLRSFMNDTLIYTVNNNRYDFESVIVDEFTGITLRLQPKDVLIFSYYCFYKSLEQEPEYIPVQYTPLVGAYSYNKTYEDIPKTFTFNGNSLQYMSNVLDRETFFLNASPQEVAYSTIDFFMTELSTSFNALILQLQFLRTRSMLTDLVGTKTAIFSLLENQHYMLNLSHHTLYSQWVSDPGIGEVASLISGYDNSVNKKNLYAELSQTLIATLMPETHPSIRAYLDADEDRASYNRIKELFTQLCSYTVLFLDTERDKRRWLFLPDISSHTPYKSKIGNIHDLTEFLDILPRYLKKRGLVTFDFGRYTLKQSNKKLSSHNDLDVANLKLHSKGKKSVSHIDDMIYLTGDTVKARTKVVKISDTIGISSTLEPAN